MVTACDATIPDIAFFKSDELIDAMAAIRLVSLSVQRVILIELVCFSGACFLIVLAMLKHNEIGVKSSELFLSFRYNS